VVKGRLKSVVRRAAIRLMGMEFDTEARDPAARGTPDPSKFDESKIPKVVDGSGDTPGPNHKENIGRTWVSAQLNGGVAPFFLDIRPPNEAAAGTLPGATLLPKMAAKEHLEMLPDKSARVTIYDATGEQESEELAAWLREQGWGLARRLQGGYAEWMEHGEPTVLPTLASEATVRIGDSVNTPTGEAGQVLSASLDGATVQINLWLDTGTVAGPFSEGDLGR